MDPNTPHSCTSWAECPSSSEFKPDDASGTFHIDQRISWVFFFSSRKCRLHFFEILSRPLTFFIQPQFGERLVDSDPPEFVVWQNHTLLIWTVGELVEMFGWAPNHRPSPWTMRRTSFHQDEKSAACLTRPPYPHPRAGKEGSLNHLASHGSFLGVVVVGGGHSMCYRQASPCTTSGCPGLDLLAGRWANINRQTTNKDKGTWEWCWRFYHCHKRHQVFFHVLVRTLVKTSVTYVNDSSPADILMWITTNPGFAVDHGLSIMICTKIDFGLNYLWMQPLSVPGQSPEELLN